MEEGNAIRRRRWCERCEFRFSTYEQSEILNLVVHKRDGRKELYDRGKIERGIEKALEKRPFTPEARKKLVAAIERDIQLLRREEVASREIGEIVMKHLKRADEVAYIRFASVYRSFKDVATFRRELKILIREPKVRTHSPPHSTNRQASVPRGLQPRGGRRKDK